MIAVDENGYNVAFTAENTHAALKTFEGLFDNVAYVSKVMSGITDATGVKQGFGGQAQTREFPV